jgi:hypothetical protein
VRWGRSGVTGDSVLLNTKRCQRLTGCPRRILLSHFTLEDENITLFRNFRISLTAGSASYPRRTECLEELIKVKFTRHNCADPIYLLVSTMLRPLYPRRKDRYPFYRRLVGSWSLYGRHGKSHTTGIRSRNHPARSDSLYRLRYPYRLEKLICFLFPFFRTLFHGNSIFCTGWTVSQLRAFLSSEGGGRFTFRNDVKFSYICNEENREENIPLMMINKSPTEKKLWSGWKVWQLANTSSFGLDCYVLVKITSAAKCSLQNKL